MPQNRSKSTKQVALILVHGIGNQQPGDTLHKFVQGLSTLYADLVVQDLKIEKDPENRFEPRASSILLPDLELKVYEAYWADILMGSAVKGSFRMEGLHEVVWFPLLNYKAQLLPRSLYSRLLIFLRTITLVPLALVLRLALEGLNLFFSFFSDSSATSKQADETQTFSERVSQKADEGVERVKHSYFAQKILDQIAADVINYMDSAGGLFESDHPLHLAQSKIVERFIDTVKIAVRQDCDEVQILAHSLGTVVAYHGLTSNRATDPDTSLPVLTRLYTIGSPLEKIRFFWPFLIDTETSLPAITLSKSKQITAHSSFEWQNYYSPLDPVSGFLKRFDHWGKIKNKLLINLGGTATAHVRYEKNPVFFNRLIEGFNGTNPSFKVPLYKQFLIGVQSLFEVLLAPFLLIICAAGGLGVYFFLAYLMSGPFMLLGWENAAEWTREIFLYLILFIILFGFTWTGYSKAVEMHQKFNPTEKES